LGAVLLISSIEEEFQIEIDTDRALKMETFDGAAQMLRELGVPD